MHRYDWREFQEFLSAGARGAAPGAPLGASPAYFVSDGDRVVSGYCQGEDLEEWQGATVASAGEHYKHREHLFVPRESMSAWLREAWENEGYYEQMLHLRNRVSGFIAEHSRQEPRAVRQVSYPHFLLEALHGWWAKVLPASYGMLIRVEAAPAASKPARRAREFFLIVRRGRFEEFGTPDLSGLGRDRAKSETETVKYLSEKYGVPFQGAFLPEKDWEEWSRIADPWKLIALALRTHKLRLTPSGLGLKALVGLRAFLGL